jgi:hypothetical protein
MNYVYVLLGFAVLILSVALARCSTREATVDDLTEAEWRASLAGQTANDNQRDEEEERVA